MKLDQYHATELRRVVEGPIRTPSDEGYSTARQPRNPALEQRPAMVAFPRHRGDVAALVRFARRQRMGIEVQAGGHGATAACDGGMLIRTNGMRGVQVDPESRRARVLAGTPWRDVMAEAHRYGLAPLAAISPERSVAGFSLAGGAGWLARRYGYAADSLLGVEIVAGDGRCLRASAAENPDLFWALRGGGGNFGVVTAVELALFPVARIYGGGICFAVEDAPAVMAGYAGWTEQLPDTFTSRLLLRRMPDAPFIPDPVRGRWMITVQGCLLGSEEEGARLLRPIRSAAPPLVDAFSEMPFLQSGSIAGNDPAQASFTGAEMLDGLSSISIDGLAEQTEVSPHLVEIEIRHLGGALGAKLETASAVSQRDAAFLFRAVATAGTAGEYRAAAEAANQARYVVAVDSTGGVTLDALTGPGVGRRVGDAFRPNVLERLLAIKREYDPANLFRFTHSLAVPQNALAAA